MITAIRHTGIVVRDIVAMRRFYIALGFQLNQTATESGQFIEQVTGRKGKNKLGEVEGSRWKSSRTT